MLAEVIELRPAVATCNGDPTAASRRLIVAARATGLPPLLEGTRAWSLLVAMAAAVAFTAMISKINFAAGGGEPSATLLIVTAFAARPATTARD